jgi:ketosteroid isomerase-like protein
MRMIISLTLSFFLVACTPVVQTSSEVQNQEYIAQLVYDHARAWKRGDIQLLYDILHEDVIFAYPGRRLNKEQTLQDLVYFNQHFIDTEVYINEIIIDANNVAVEWQFATTNKDTGKRQVVSDAIIGKVKDGKIIVWKEYLDGRVKKLQATGELSLEEGKEPFPWPLRT